jgi:hypothetical protein
MTRHPAHQLRRDLKHVRVWLETLHLGTGARLLVHWHRNASSRALSHVVVHGRGDPAVHQAMWRDASPAMVALGYRINPASIGPRTLVEVSERRSMSAHARIEGIRRVLAALGDA